VLPLDGGQMLNAALGPTRIKITLWITIATAIIAGFTIFRLSGSIMFPIFLGMFGYQAYQALQQFPRR
jgi:stage IV sporulation protein FB